MTNREHINAMSNKELAEYTRDNFLWFCGECKLIDICKNKDRRGSSCVESIMKWFDMED